MGAFGELQNIIIAAIIVIAAATAAFYAIYPRGHHGEGSIPESGDLCSGTGGTGQIVSRGRHTITIKRKDGFVQTLNLTSRTMIRSSAGAISESSLKIGDHVTLVVTDGKTASTVLVCDVAGSKTQLEQ